MLLNEDYFKNIEINDEDIYTELPENIQLNPVEYNNYLTSHYSRNIKIVINLPYQEQLSWLNSVLPQKMKRIDYIFKAYNVEYEYIICDESGPYASPDRTLKSHEVGQYIIFSHYNKEQLFKNVSYLYINIYVNCPHFSYRESYYFIDNLQQAIWKNDDAPYTLSISNQVISLYDFKSSYDMYIFKLNKYLRNSYILRYDKVATSFKTFFEDAILCFRNTPEDKKQVEEMLDYLHNGLNPFLNS